MHDYAKVLLPFGAPTPPPLICPLDPPLFYPTRGEKCHCRLQFGRAQDHAGLVGEHFIYAHDTLLSLLANIFNRAMREGFSSIWEEHSIVPIPSNYRINMIGHREMIAVQLDRQVSERGLQLPITFRPLEHGKKP